MKKIFYYLLFFTVIFYVNVSANEVNEIFNIRLIERNDYVRVLFEMEQKPKYYVAEMNDNSIRVDILNSKLIDEKLYKIIENTNEIKNINFHQTNNSSVFFINLQQDSHLKRFLYTAPDNINNFYRLIVDINKSQPIQIDNQEQQNNVSDLDSFLTLLDENNEEQNLNDFLYQHNMFEFDNIDELIEYSDDELKDIKSIETQNNSNFELNNFIDEIYKADKKIKDNKPLKQSKNKINVGQKQFTVVLDAGHGGKDSGAVGRRRTLEKNINLMYVREIAKYLENYKNIKVILTRNSDKFIELTDRVIISMNSQADLFISIHADSSTNSKAKGASIYTLNDEGFYTRTTEIIKKTNGFFAYLRNKNKLISSAKKNNLYESSRVAKLFVNDFKKNKINMLSNPHKKANFAVLLSPNYPSLLIELAFLSNSQDEKMLNSYSYRKHISKVIAESIIKCFNTKENNS